MKKGFTIIEVTVAVSILTMAVVGSFILVQQTLKAASLNESKLVAAYLAQEGIEIVRNIRDSNWLESRGSGKVGWDEDIFGIDYCDPCCCEVSYNDTSLAPHLEECSNDDFQFLNIDDNGFYSYAEGTTTIFKRKIVTEKDEENDDVLKVSVEVMWEKKGEFHSIEAIDYLSNWSWYGN